MIINKYTVGAAALVVSALGGYYLGRETVIKTVTVHDVQTVTRTVNHIVTVTRTVHPDGTVTETTRTEDKQVDKEKRDESTASTSTPIGSNYSLGVRYHLRPADVADLSANPYRGFEVTAGRRILGDIWLDAGIQPLTRDVSVGIRLDL